MNTVDVSKLVRVEKEPGFGGSLKVMSKPKMVTVTLRIKEIPQGGGVIKLHLPWGKIFGVTKKAQPPKAAD